VRYLSNYSTGEVAYLLCDELIKNGFQVVAAIGPSSFPFERLRLKALVRVETHFEMHEAVMSLCRKYRPHSAVFSAAVLDFAPKRIVKGKTSSDKKEWKISLVPTKKIIDEVGKRYPEMVRVGFKLETKLYRGKAKDKFALGYLSKKNLQGLFLNFLSEIKSKKHSGDFYSSSGKVREVNSKKAIAREISNFLLAPF
jgi:phosphopantothenoylcysteine decarboxylase/phosphopantothenate--cysteine ligase